MIPSPLATGHLWTLTHWGRVTYICVSKLSILGSDNGLSPGRRQPIIRTNAGILLIRPLGTIFSVILVQIIIFSFKKMRLKVWSAKRRPFCHGLNELSSDICRYLLSVKCRAHLTSHPFIFLQSIKQIMVEEKVRGFAKVMVTKDIVEGINIA